MIARLDLNSTEKVILPTGDDAIDDKPYVTTIGEMYTKTSIQYTKGTSIHYQTLPKKATNSKIDVNNLSFIARLIITYLFIYCKAYCYYFLINVVILPTKVKYFITQASRKI